MAGWNNRNSPSFVVSLIAGLGEIGEIGGMVGTAELATGLQEKHAARRGEGSLKDS
jgi:hypothetical protein